MSTYISACTHDIEHILTAIPHIFGVQEHSAMADNERCKGHEQIKDDMNATYLKPIWSVTLNSLTQKGSNVYGHFADFWK